MTTKTLLWAIAIVVVIFALYTLAMIMTTTREDAALFGDSFGALNTLFSGLAFSAILLTLIMQRDQLKVQQDDLKATLEEMKENRKEQSEQTEQLRESVRSSKRQLELMENTMEMSTQQVFESQLASLCNSYWTTINAIIYFYPSANNISGTIHTPMTGNQALGIIKEEIKSGYSIKRYLEVATAIGFEPVLGVLSHTADFIHKHTPEHLGQEHYFRTVGCMLSENVRVLALAWIKENPNAVLELVIGSGHPSMALNKGSDQSNNEDTH